MVLRMFLVRGGGSVYIGLWGLVVEMGDDLLRRRRRDALCIHANYRLCRGKSEN